MTSPFLKLLKLKIKNGESYNLCLTRPTIEVDRGSVGSSSSVDHTQMGSDTAELQPTRERLKERLRLTIQERCSNDQEKTHEASIRSRNPIARRVLGTLGT